MESMYLLVFLPLCDIESFRKSKKDDLRQALLEALRRSHVEFVELLIEFGTPLENLTYGDLKNLYNIEFVRKHANRQESWEERFLNLFSLEIDYRWRRNVEELLEHKLITIPIIFARWR